MAREFSHPNFGNTARVEWEGCEVRLIFEAYSAAQAESMARTLVQQLKDGALNLTLMGKPMSIEES